jgi:hypothetical protein
MSLLAAASLIVACVSAVEPFTFVYQYNEAVITVHRLVYDSKTTSRLLFTKLNGFYTITSIIIA